MKVKCKSSNKFLIKDEWYHVKHVSHVDKPTNYEIINHTDRKWNTTWYNSINFYTLQELRDLKLKELGI
jgi:hypothetical protein